MLVKNLLVPLVGLAVAAEAVSVHSYRSAPGDGLVRRQGQFNFGKGKNGKNNNNQNNQQGKNNNDQQGKNNNNQQGKNNNDQQGKNNNKNNNQGKNNNDQQGKNNNDQQGKNNNNNQNNNNNNQNNQGSATCLAPNAIQTGSQQTGQNGQVADGQVESAMYVALSEQRELLLTILQ